MIEYRTYDGGPEEAARFTCQVWLPPSRGRVTIPVWDEAYFDWQLLGGEGRSRDYLVAAYRGSRLVGCSFAEPFRFRFLGEEIDATMGGWLSVDPGERRNGIASGLLLEHRKRLLDRGAKFSLGFAMSGGGRRRFWAHSGGDTVFAGKIYCWTYVLDPVAVARAEARLDRRLGAQLLGLVGATANTPARDVDVRPYHPADLDACVALVGRAVRDVDLAYVWSRSRLAHQLDYRGFPRTLILCPSGAVVGLVNYYPITLQSRALIRAAIIDYFLAPDVAFRDRRRLMRQALSSMREEGIELVLTSRLSGVSARTLAACGFLPVWPGIEVVCYRADPRVDVRRARTLQVHLR